MYSNLTIYSNKLVTCPKNLPMRDTPVIVRLSILFFIIYRTEYFLT